MSSCLLRVFYILKIEKIKKTFTRVNAFLPQIYHKLNLLNSMTRQKYSLKILFKDENVKLYWNGRQMRV